MDPSRLYSSGNGDLLNLMQVRMNLVTKEFHTETPLNDLRVQAQARGFEEDEDLDMDVARHGHQFGDRVNHIVSDQKRKWFRYGTASWFVSLGMMFTRDKKMFPASYKDDPKLYAQTEVVMRRYDSSRRGDRVTKVSFTSMPPLSVAAVDAFDVPYATIPRYGKRKWYRKCAFREVDNHAIYTPNSKSLNGVAVTGSIADEIKFVTHSPTFLPVVRDRENAGLAASQEYQSRRHVRHHDTGQIIRHPSRIYMILAAGNGGRDNPKKGKRNTDPNQITEFGLRYTLVESRHDLIELMKIDNPCDRHYMEVITNTTPHRFFMDIERDLDGMYSKPRKDLMREVNKCREGLINMFIPLMCSFFTDVMKVSVKPENCFISDASLPGKKFSVHIVIDTPEKLHCTSRCQQYIVAMLFEEYCRQYAQASTDFKAWYMVSDNFADTVVDWSVYGTGTRNMRLLGSCKLNKLKVGQMKRTSRILITPRSQHGENFESFLCTFYGALSRSGTAKTFHFTEEHYKRFLQHCHDSNALLKRLNRDARRSGGKVIPNAFTRYYPALRYLGVNHIAVPGVPSMHARESLRPFGMTIGNANFNSGPAMLTPKKNRLVELWKAIQDRARAPPTTDQSIDKEISYSSKEQHKTYAQAADLFLRDVIETIHPHAYYTIGNGDKSYHVVSARFCPKEARFGEERRFCHLDCFNAGGNHYVTVSILPDFSVEYFCHGCSNTKIIINSPIRLDMAKSNPSALICPDDMAPAMIDYSALRSADYVAGEDDRYMRSIRPFRNQEGRNMLPGTNKIDPTCKYLPPDLLPVDGESTGGHRTMTVVLHGGMGTGKTYTMKNYIDKLEAEKEDVSILAISFRRMLAQMFAKKFKLTLYSDKEGCPDITKAKRLSIQLESLPRLAPKELTDEDEDDISDNHIAGNSYRYLSTFRNQWTVVIIDEIESVLEQFSSDTMRTRLLNTWKIFTYIIRHAPILAVADADIGERTWWMLRTYRSSQRIHPCDRVVKDKVLCPIPALQYHRNHHVGIPTEYIDHAGEWEFFKSLFEDLVINRKRIFFFSNAVSQMKRYKSFIILNINHYMDELLPYVEDAPDQYPELVTEFEEMQSILAGIKLICADSSETEKQGLANCNERWLEYRLLFISPTVGAGIDFSVKGHFDKAYGYGSSRSNTARGLMQMKGRVRHLTDNICHLFFPDDPSERQVRGAQLTTFEAARDFLRLNAKRHEDDRLIVSEAADGTLHFGELTQDSDLLKLLSYNIMLKTKSRVGFRSAILDVLMSSNPDVKYRFDQEVDPTKNLQFQATMMKIDETVDQHENRHLAHQPDKMRSDARLLRSMDIAGAAPDHSVSSVLKKSDIREFFGLDMDISPENFERILKIVRGSPIGRNDSIKRMKGFVRNALFVLFAPYDYIKAINKRDNGHYGVSLEVQIPGKAGDKARSTFQSAGAALQEPQGFSIRVRLTELMFFAGFLLDGVYVEDDHVKVKDPSRALCTSISSLEAHRSLSVKRCKEFPAAMKRVWGKAIQMCDMLDINITKQEDALNEISLYNVTRVIFRDLFGITLALTDQSVPCPAPSEAEIKKGKTVGKKKQLKCTMTGVKGHGVYSVVDDDWMDVDVNTPPPETKNDTTYSANGGEIKFKLKRRCAVAKANPFHLKHIVVLVEAHVRAAYEIEAKNSRPGPLDSLVHASLGKAHQNVSKLFAELGAPPLPFTRDPPGAEVIQKGRKRQRAKDAQETPEEVQPMEVEVDTNEKDYGQGYGMHDGEAYDNSGGYGLEYDEHRDAAEEVEEPEPPQKKRKKRRSKLPEMSAAYKIEDFNFRLEEPAPNLVAACESQESMDGTSTVASDEYPDFEDEIMGINPNVTMTDKELLGDAEVEAEKREKARKVAEKMKSLLRMKRYFNIKETWRAVVNKYTGGNPYKDYTPDQFVSEILSAPLQTRVMRSLVTLRHETNKRKEEQNKRFLETGTAKFT